jgi:uncharacterized membrane protein YdjX (TVP38/TMEM64 family)
VLAAGDTMATLPASSALPASPGKARELARLLWRPLLLLGGLLAAGLALRLLPGGGPMVVLSRLGALPHGAAEVGFVLAAAALCAVGVPRQVAGYAGGYAFGLWGGVALALAAQVLGCLINFLWARVLARDWAQRRLAGRLARLDAFLRANPFLATLMLRLLPVGNNLALNLLAGLSGVAAAPFLLASAIGYVPQTVVFALVGIGTRLDRGAELALGGTLFVAAAALGVLLLRRLRAGGTLPG